jgi:hypothetical protein
VSLPAELYRRAEVLSMEEGLEACKKIGFPVMIKASEVSDWGWGRFRFWNSDCFYFCCFNFVLFWLWCVYLSCFVAIASEQ